MARSVLVPTPVREAAVRLVLATQPGQPLATASVRNHVRYGASPRGLIDLLRAARARALLEGRVQAALADLAVLAVPVLRHRLLLGIDSEIAGVAVDEVVAEVVAACLQD